MSASALAIGAFTREDFKATEFVRQQRTRVDLERLTNELNELSEALKEQLFNVIQEDYQSFLKLTTELGGVDHVVLELSPYLADCAAELKALRNAIARKVSAVEHIAAEQGALAVRRRALRLELEMAISLESAERTLANRPHLYPDGDMEALRDTDNTSRLERARLLERAADQLHRINTISALQDVPRIPAGMADRLAVARETCLRELCVQALWSIRSGDCLLLDSSLRALDALDASMELVEVVRLKVVRPRVRSLIAQASTSPQANELFVALSQFVTADLAVFTKRMVDGSTQERPLPRPFHGIATAVWPEVCAQLIADRPGLFGAGVPDTFHANYVEAMRFVATIEAACPDECERAELLAHASTADFLRRWNLPLYFQVRLNEVTEVFEKELLSGTELVRHDLPVLEVTTSMPQMLRLRASVALVAALDRCADTRVVLRELAHRFLKLALQLVERYMRWADALVQEAAPADASTHAAGSSRGVPAVATDVAVFAALIADVSDMCEWLNDGFATTFAHALEIDHPPAVHAKATRACFAQIAERLQRQSTPAREVVCLRLAEECAESLGGVRGIAATYRFQGKEMPSRPSPFMEYGLKPLSTFVDAGTPVLASQDMQVVADTVIAAVARRYAGHVRELVQTVHRTETSIKKLQPRKKEGVMDSSVDVRSLGDSDKIFAQLRLDALAFRAHVKSIVPEELWKPEVGDALHELDSVLPAQGEVQL